MKKVWPAERLNAPQQVIVSACSHISVSHCNKLPLLQGATDNAAPQYLVDDERKYPSRESLGPLCELRLGILCCMAPKG
jgi:hypothetical protein